jgi:hypothetical protein
MIMSKHIIKLEILYKKFQARYGQNDSIAIELQREIELALKKKSRPQIWSTTKSPVINFKSAELAEMA